MTMGEEGGEAATASRPPATTETAHVQNEAPEGLTDEEPTEAYMNPEKTGTPPTRTTLSGAQEPVWTRTPSASLMR